MAVPYSAAFLTHQVCVLGHVILQLGLQVALDLHNLRIQRVNIFAQLFLAVSELLKISDVSRTFPVLKRDPQTQRRRRRGQHFLALGQVSANTNLVFGLPHVGVHFRQPGAELRHLHLHALDLRGQILHLGRRQQVQQETFGVTIKLCKLEKELCKYSTQTVCAVAML